jgi:coenzyme F420-0:L-glutamate ligase/coenzyme F420-1:gamma-L-glutamate ligase
MIEIFAPSGIAEVTAGADVAGLIASAIRAERRDGLRHGDIVVVTSKIISKAEGRFAPADRRQEIIDAQTVRTLTRRRSMAIVETPQGLVQAGAGVDDSNVRLGQILLLPQDPDASAEQLRAQLSAAFDARIGVIISDTAGRTWRLGQTDHAIGAAGIRVLNAYAGRFDEYGNQLQVTMIAIADELAGAADLAKQKLAGRPVAVIRGAGQHVLTLGSAAEPDAAAETRDADRDVSRVCAAAEPEVADVEDTDRDAADAGDADRTGREPVSDVPTRAADLQRQEDDLFQRGSRESVLWALLEAVGHPERYEAVVRLEDRDQLTAAITADADLSQAEHRLVAKIVKAAQPIWP